MNMVASCNLSKGRTIAFFAAAVYEALCCVGRAIKVTKVRAIAVVEITLF